MNRILRTLIPFILLMLALEVFGQDQPFRGERLRQYRISFITARVNLTPDEAEKFWPLYNEYTNKMAEFVGFRIQDAMLPADLDQMSEEEVEKLLNEQIERKEKELSLYREYHEKYKAVLPIHKVAKVYQAEAQFKRELMRRISGRDGGDRRGGMRGR